MPSPTDRESPRVALSLKATIGGHGFLKVPVALVDASRHGCRIGVSSRLTRGGVVTLNIGFGAGHPGRVVWSDGRFAGLEFCTPLTVEVFDRLVKAAVPADDPRGRPEFGPRGLVPTNRTGVSFGRFVG